MAEALTIVFCIVMLVITCALTVIYCTNPKFKTISHQFNIIFTLNIVLDYSCRLFPNALCEIQAFLLTLFDKLMLTLMTSFSFIWCFIILNKEELKNTNKEKKLYIFTNIIGLILSLVCTIIFYIQGTSVNSEFCYVDTRSEVKQWIDSIVIIILFIINFVCLIIIIVKTNELKDENGKVVIKEVYIYDLKRFIIGLFINIIIFIYVFLLIIKKMPFDNIGKDIIYMILSLFADIYIIANEELKNYFKRCCGNENQIDNNNNSDQPLMNPENNANNDENNI